jgi:hypothetical protein
MYSVRKWLGEKFQRESSFSSPLFLPARACEDLPRARVRSRSRAFAGEVESEQRCVGTLVAFVARDVRPSISMVLADVRHVAS